jgi:DNA-binding transcriptional LysR family regulator
MTTDPAAPRRTPLGALELLVAIEAHGSITAAAHALGVAQPSLSSGLRRLERQTGLSLVTRSPAGTMLTELGRRVVGRARDVLAASDAFEGEVAALRSEQGGRLTVAASMTIAEYLVPRWLAARPAGAAVVDLDVANSRAVMEAVLHGRADLGFIEGPDLADGLRGSTVRSVLPSWPAHRSCCVRPARGPGRRSSAPSRRPGTRSPAHRLSWARRLR